MVSDSGSEKDWDLVPQKQVLATPNADAASVSDELEKTMTLEDESPVVIRAKHEVVGNKKAAINGEKPVIVRTKHEVVAAKDSAIEGKEPVINCPPLEDGYVKVKGQGTGIVLVKPVASAKEKSDVPTEGSAKEASAVFVLASAKEKSAAPTKPTVSKEADSIAQTDEGKKLKARSSPIDIPFRPAQLNTTDGEKTPKIDPAEFWNETFRKKQAAQHALPASDQGGFTAREATGCRMLEMFNRVRIIEKKEQAKTIEEMERYTAEAYNEAISKQTLVEPAKAPPATSNVTYATHAGKTHMCIKPVREGWEARISRTTGKVYYVDHLTQSTTWTHPGSGIGENSQRVPIQVPTPKTTAAAPIEATAATQRRDPMLDSREDGVNKSRMQALVEGAKRRQPVMMQNDGRAAEVEKTDSKAPVAAELTNVNTPTQTRSGKTYSLGKPPTVASSSRQLPSYHAHVATDASSSRQLPSYHALATNIPTRRLAAQVSALQAGGPSINGTQYCAPRLRDPPSLQRPQPGQDLLELSHHNVRALQAEQAQQAHRAHEEAKDRYLKNLAERKEAIVSSDRKLRSPTKARGGLGSRETPSIFSRRFSNASRTGASGSSSKRENVSMGPQDVVTGNEGSGNARTSFDMSLALDGAGPEETSARRALNPDWDARRDLDGKWADYSGIVSPYQTTAFNSFH